MRARLERGKLQVNYGNVNLEEVTRDIVNELAPLTNEKEQNVSIKSAAMPDLWADSQLARQAILNL